MPTTKYTVTVKLTPAQARGLWSLANRGMADFDHCTARDLGWEPAKLEAGRRAMNAVIGALEEAHASGVPT